MADDQVTIDPQFSPPPPDDGQGRWLRPAGIVAVGVAAFILGWLLKSPSPAESEPDEVAVTSSTALSGEAVVASTTTRPRSTTTTTEPSEMVGLEVPLGEAVPGFADTLTMIEWGEHQIEVLRWRVSESTPEVLLSFDQDEDAGWFAGLDASGRWAAQVTWSGLLTVHPVPESIDEQWPEGFDEAVDVWVTEPPESTPPGPWPNLPPYRSAPPFLATVGWPLLKLEFRSIERKTRCGTSSSSGGWL